MQSFHISVLPTVRCWRKSSGQAQTKSILSAPVLETLGKIIWCCLSSYTVLAFRSQDLRKAVKFCPCTEAEL